MFVQKSILVNQIHVLWLSKNYPNKNILRWYRVNSFVRPPLVKVPSCWIKGLLILKEMFFILAFAHIRDEVSKAESFTEVNAKYSLFI